MRKPIVTSATVDHGAPHDVVKVWNRGGLAGILIVHTGDGERFAEALAAMGGQYDVTRGASSGVSYVVKQ